MEMAHSFAPILQLRWLFLPHWMFWLCICISVLAGFVQTIRRKKYSMWFTFFSGYAELLIWQSFTNKVLGLHTLVQLSGLRMNGLSFPGMVFGAMLLCVILNKIVCLGGIKHTVCHLLNTYFKWIETLRALVIKLAQSEIFTATRYILLGIYLFLSVICLYDPSSSICEKSELSFLLAFVWTIWFARLALHSARKLLCVWIIGLLPFFLFGMPQNSSLDFHTWFLYCALAAFGVVWSIIISGMADTDPVRMASLTISTFSALIALIGNVFSPFISEWLANTTILSSEWSDAVCSAFQLLFNMFMLPLLISGLLAGFAKEVQVYWKNRASKPANPQDC